MKTINLENYKSLTEEELYDTNGGIAPVVIAGGLLVVGAGAGMWDAYEESQAKKKKKKK
ncbi:class IIb bacteriocin, lactobin A/cerein 7B family [Bacillus cereus]|uniref:class IIb bacteriocin, lactobin A/cerein 7B family n=1 Tax=Bacillus cereus TaxID=1396 RepID=UPI000B4AF717|nr:class IIb bacteriocin, lactobin A/cerein 7B family [Bacillus cereus]MDA2630950.1 class IIb bacteriocin, lactobin A/cerein 7B family [Bacillus cereus]WAI17244.1 class IIb bacteriocin, lactobin A/cerein 7B family [Bacillus cereus]